MNFILLKHYFVNLTDLLFLLFHCLSPELSWFFILRITYVHIKVWTYEFYQQNYSIKAFIFRQIFQAYLKHTLIYLEVINMWLTCISLSIKQAPINLIMLSLLFYNNIRKALQAQYFILEYKKWSNMLFSEICVCVCTHLPIMMGQFLLVLVISTRRFMKSRLIPVLQEAGESQV